MWNLATDTLVYICPNDKGRLKQLKDVKKVRSWDSVCVDCAHLLGMQCLAIQARAAPDDSFAAVCEWFEETPSEEEQNYKSTPVE